MVTQPPFSSKPGACICSKGGGGYNEPLAQDYDRGAGGGAGANDMFAGGSGQGELPLPPPWHSPPPQLSVAPQAQFNMCWHQWFSALPLLHALARANKVYYHSGVLTVVGPCALLQVGFGSEGAHRARL